MLHTQHNSPIDIMISPTNIIKEKLQKYNMLVQTLKDTGWKVYHLIVVTIGIRGAIHTHPIQTL